MIRIAACVISLLLSFGTASAAELKVFADGPLEYALMKIGAGFQKETGHKITFVFAVSPVIERRISAGEPADIVIVQPGFIATLEKNRKVPPGEHAILTRVGFGIGVRTQTPSPDISNPEAFKQALLNADSLICTNRASGDHFVKVLERLGIADAVRAKVSRLEPDDVFVKVLAGKGNDFAVGTITQIKGTAGLKLVGPLPGDLQSNIPYMASATSTTKVGDVANAFITYISSSRAKAEFVAAGGE